MLHRLTFVGLVLFLLPRGGVCDRDSFHGTGFAYRSHAFEKFVDDSYRVNGGNPRDFYEWFDRSFEKATGSGVDQFLAVNRARLNTMKGRPRVLGEMQLAITLHDDVRKMLPFFSLEHGFEFTEAARHGKRQCLLQSVLISSMLQKAGLDSGIVMVFRKPDGTATNNSHNVALLRLSDGTDVLVDGSSQAPFVEHRGILVRNIRGGRLYVDPIYDRARPGVITSYGKEGTRELISRNQLGGLDDAFIASQFDYYRGEQVENGVMAKRSSPSGLRTSLKFLQRSVQECPENPLAVYVLGRAYRMSGNVDAARVQFQRARYLYSECGWIPESVRSLRL